MSKELPKNYNPQEVEDKIYQAWEKSGYFNPDNIDGEPYSIMMPPPNVTGVLHLGHSLENSIMDVMARFQRMQGKKVLLLPGTDHAAIATQAKVEKNLVEKGIKNPREELGREKLLEEIRKYSENSKSIILKQIRKMGTGCDWSRLAYTFDEKRSAAVNEVFVKMYNDELIYRGYRVVNWSVNGQSTLSDDEIEYKEQKTKLYTFKYSKDFPISIATTRPETKLGDTAVAVNPNDKRYKKYIGQTFTVEVGAAKPLEIKIIADKNVDPKFGTGALGVTPAHSAVDFEMYEKQKAKNNAIGIIPVIGTDGKMNSAAGKNYKGLSVSEARKGFVAYLKKNGLLEKEDEIIHNIGYSDRFGDIVESLPMTQWFVNVNKEIPGKNKSLKQLMHDAVSIGHNNDPEKKIEIIPERFEKTYFSWIENLRDWCISRQIWWGHRIPVWYRDEEIYCGTTPPESAGWQQDSDTLDTWFSSGLWTFSTLGWPENTADFKAFHPSNWMQMGYEILFFWMARMILMTTYTLDAIPFRDVYIHGMVRDEKGKKFSKSSGNNLDPIEIIDKYGCDALRLSLITGVSPGNDFKFYEEKVKSSRNFVTKLWNISRYVITSVSENVEGEIKKDGLSLFDKWIMGKFSNLIIDVSNDLNNFRFSKAGEKLREFTWNKLADWYLEISKFEFEKTSETEKILIMILRDLLKLWHPFMPFVTEHIWSNVLKEKNLLMIEKWPEVNYSEKFEITQDDTEKAEIIIDIISKVREVRTSAKIKPNKKISLSVGAKEDKTLIETIRNHKELIMKFKTVKTDIENLEIIELDKKIGRSAYRTIRPEILNIQIPLDKFEIENERNSIQNGPQSIADVEKYLSGVKRQLENEHLGKNRRKRLENTRRDNEPKLPELKKRLKYLN